MAAPTCFEPLPRSTSFVDLHRKIDAGFFASRDFLIEVSETALELKVVSINRPEHDRRNQCDRKQARLHVGRAKR